jgi:hypothetical protein
MSLEVPKEKINVKIKTNSAIVAGNIHIMPGSRVIDYIRSQFNKFIPVTNTIVYPLEKGIEENVNISGKYDIVFLNVENIQMITVTKEEPDSKE